MKNIDKEKYQDPYQYIGFLVWVIGNIFGQSMDNSSANKDKILFSNFMVLAALYWLLNEKDNIINQRTLAKYTHLREITVSTIIKKLTKQGYVAISIDKSDKRSKSLLITSKGVNFLRAMLDDVIEKEAKINKNGLSSLKQGLAMLLKEVSNEH